MALRTDESKHEDEPGDDRPRPAWTRTAKRYGPFVAVVVVIGIAVALFGGGGDDGDEGGGDSATGVDAAVDNDELIASGPMTWQKAEAEGRTEDIDWGPGCDTELGTVKLPVVGAPPCVEPFTGDNGGATSPGVTADEVKIVYYTPDPTTDPAGAALLSATGADVNPDTAFQVVEDYAALYNQVFETYGRHVTVERYTATGPGDDVETARADAIAIAGVRRRAGVARHHLRRRLRRVDPRAGGQGVLPVHLPTGRDPRSGGRPGGRGVREPGRAGSG